MDSNTFIKTCKCFGRTKSDVAKIGCLSTKVVFTLLQRLWLIMCKKIYSNIFNNCLE